MMTSPIKINKYSPRSGTGALKIMLYSHDIGLSSQLETMLENKSNRELITSVGQIRTKHGGEFADIIVKVLSANTNLKLSTADIFKRNVTDVLRSVNVVRRQFDELPN